MMARQPRDVRKALIAKGLLDADGNVTPAGETYTRDLIERLKRTRIEPARGKTVRWN